VQLQVGSVQRNQGLAIEGFCLETDPLDSMIMMDAGVFLIARLDRKCHLPRALIVLQQMNPEPKNGGLCLVFRFRQERPQPNVCLKIATLLAVISCCPRSIAYVCKIFETQISAFQLLVA